MTRKINDYCFFFVLAVQFIFLAIPDTCSSVRLTDGAADNNLETGHIRVIVDSPNVKVAINGQPEGLAHPDRPLMRRYIPVGEARVEAKMKGTAPKRKDITVKKDETVEIEFHFNHYRPVTKTIDTPEPMNELEKASAIDTLLEKGDAYFKRERYTTPYGKNAFSMYKAVLEKDPENSKAQQKIQEMLKKYIELAEEYRSSDLTRVIFSYQQYIFIAEYALKAIKHLSLPDSLENIRDRMNELKSKQEKIAELDKTGDAFFRARKYTTPPGENAFETYKAVLAVDPENDRAVRKIQRMMNDYIKWGNQDAPIRPDQAAEHYRKSADLAQFLLGHSRDQKFERKLNALNRKIEKFSALNGLFEKADTLFDSEQFITPEKENALRYYQDILSMYPDNKKAEQRIMDMANYCLSMGEKAYSEANYALSKFYYEQYLKINESCSQSMPKTLLPGKAASVRARLKTANHQIIINRLARQKQELRRDMERYERLKRIEAEGVKNVADDIVQALNVLVDTLRKIEKLYEQAADFEVRMRPKMDLVESALERLEQEIEIRMDKAA